MSQSSSPDALLAQRLKELLDAGGVDCSDGDIDDGKNLSHVLMCRLEEWLGLSPIAGGANEVGKMKVNNTEYDDADDNMVVLMEDVTPLSPQIYPILQNILIDAFHPNANGDPLQHHLSNVLLDYQNQHHLTTPLDMSLLKAMGVVRVVRWLRYWMDLNIMGPSMLGTGGDDDVRSTLSHLLLNEAATTSESTPPTAKQQSSSSSSLPQLLIQALYHHVEILPQLQSHIHLYTQSLMRNSSINSTVVSSSSSAPTTSTGSSLVTLATPPTSNSQNDDPHTMIVNKPGVGLTGNSPSIRLQQYQQQQNVISNLTREWEEHLERLEYVLGEWYTVSNVPQRKQMRSNLGRIWSQFIARTSSGSSTGGSGIGIGGGVRLENTTASGIAMTLRILHRILRGVKASDGSNGDAATTTVTMDVDKRNATNSESNSGRRQCWYEHLLFQQLLPLHAPNSMVLWRDQTSLLELYHEPLVQCIATIIQKIIPARSSQSSSEDEDRNAWIGKLILGLIEPKIWGGSKGGGGAGSGGSSGNTPKLVLLLHEIDTYISLLTINESSSDAEFLNPLLNTLGQCMSSDHSRLAERALAFFKNKTFTKMVLQQRTSSVGGDRFDTSLRILFPYLVQREMAWNPTVRKMTYNVLKTFQDKDPDRFLQICNDVYPIEDNGAIDGSAANSATNQRRPGTIKLETNPDSDGTIATTGFTLKAGMAGWKPPSESTSSNSTSSRLMPPPQNRPSGSKSGTKSPPLTVTGVAPWAMNRQPTQSQRRGPVTNGGSAPPLTVTGVAPWAMKQPQRLPNRSGMGQNPPSTVTGVAPWAVKGQQRQPLPNRLPTIGSGGGPSPQIKKRLPGMRPVPMGALTEAPSESTECGIDGVDRQVADTPTKNAENSVRKNRVIRYMEQIAPPDEESGVSSWSKAQMAESPTLLPTLKFHDLVFGHELGHGAFGNVKYARLIDRKKTRSYWNEYAVKIISTEKIQEMGYEKSVQREIAVLRVLSHPGIARLVSSFQFREGVYLVLEYAGAGDLHSLLVKNGSLDHDSTRFVMGEVAAALFAIHEAGLVYGDLKPENIVITETGHCKLTDFGGCRPVTEAAKELIASSAKNLLKRLRDGDWKPQKQKPKKPKCKEKFSDGWGEEQHGETGEDAEDEGFDNEILTDVQDEDLRVEGTTAYLPPEVVMGGVPTLAADSWAFGCVLYQCLSGRPPILEDDDDMTRHKIVTFEVSAGSATCNVSEAEDPLFRESHASGIDTNARNLIKGALNRHASERLDIRQVANHDFFVESGTDVFTLYRQPAHPLDVGNVSPVADAQWSRRQFSSIWAPQPQAYDINLNTEAANGKKLRGSANNGPILEGEEAGSFFLRSAKQSGGFHNIPLPTGGLRHIAEQTPLAQQ